MTAPLLCAQISDCPPMAACLESAAESYRAAKQLHADTQERLIQSKLRHDDSKAQSSALTLLFSNATENKDQLNLSKTKSALVTWHRHHTEFKTRARAVHLSESDLDAPRDPSLGMPQVWDGMHA